MDPNESMRMRRSCRGLSRPQLQSGKIVSVCQQNWAANGYTKRQAGIHDGYIMQCVALYLVELGRSRYDEFCSAKEGATGRARAIERFEGLAGGTATLQGERRFGGEAPFFAACASIGRSRDGKTGDGASPASRRPCATVEAVVAAGRDNHHPLHQALVGISERTACASKRPKRPPRRVLSCRSHRGAVGR
jgi:hypothetical protein